jgi:cytochrome c peroxidase
MKRRHATAKVALATLSALLAGSALAAIGTATLGTSGVTAAIVPEAGELNQAANVFVAGQLNGQWFVRGTALNDWRPYTGGALPVAQQLALKAQNPIALTDLSIASQTGMVLYLGYTTAAGPLNAPGHLRAVFTVPAAVTLPGNQQPPGLLPAVTNGEGASATFVTAGKLDTTNLFFKPFGNGRSCASCHASNAGWSITPETLGARFTTSNGNDPVFRLVDGANSPNAAVDTVDQRFAAYSMLRTKGLIRVGIGIPAGAEFTLSAGDDPYHYASAKELSLFRRPLPTTNLSFQTALMWDGRETATATGGNLCIRNSNPLQCYAALNVGLAHQANDAVTGHAQFAAGLAAAEQQQIVSFEQALFTTQWIDNNAGALNAGGAQGGPIALAGMPFHFGMNDVAAGDYATGKPFDRQVMTLFNAWRNADKVGTGAASPDALAKASIARGQDLFNNKLFNIAGVRGFNDELRRPTVQGSCASCHSTPNVGTHSVPRFMDTGLTAALLRTPDLPLYTLRNTTTGETIQTTDPGRALITGKWADIGKMKVPSLRGLESRSPYFHNGSQNDLAQLIRFYDRRFRIGFTDAEVADLAAFLKAL